MRHSALPLTMAAVCVLPGCFSEGRAERAAEANRSSWEVEQPDFFGDDPSTPELDRPLTEPRAVAVQMNSDRLPVLTPQASVELAAFFPADAQLVGVALDGRDESALPYVLEAHSGLYRVTEA